MQPLSPTLLGRGFIQLPYNTPIRTSDQFLDAATQEWSMSYAFTSECVRTNGIRPYRRAVSVCARLSLVWPVVKKVWRRKVLTLFK